MTRCSVCGSRKAGKNKLCWRHDRGRRARKGLRSPIEVTNPKQKIIKEEEKNERNQKI